MLCLFVLFKLLDFNAAEFVLLSASAWAVVVSPYFSMDHFVLQNPVLRLHTSYTPDAFYIVPLQA